MKNHIYLLLVTIFTLSLTNVHAQKFDQKQRATLFVASNEVIEVPSIASQIADGTFKPAEDIKKEVNPKRWGKNTAIPGKGYPRGNDPLMEKQMQAIKTLGRAPILTFEAASATVTPTDPTGAVGPDHFVNSWNSSFRVWDKSGNSLIPASSLGTIFPGTMGDPIVMYDRYADRFFISEFYSNGFDVAVSQGPDPVNDGWYVYRFATNSFPDYPKFSVWSDGYYITANKDQSAPSTSEVVFALERDKMLTGDPTAQMIGFSLPGCITSGFYSPMGFNCNGSTLPPAGNAPIVYMQDDAWSNVSDDHLKIWSIDVNWTTPGNSTISSPQIITTADFDGLFNNGSFSNLSQPSGSDIDALQATIMYMAQYRRFPDHNSVVFNFVVDPTHADDNSAIRWYELRQTNHGDPWTIYQEGTYVQPDGHSAFCGNMCMDASGNIALAYTTVSSSINPALRYTGRFAGDPLGTMTMAEETIYNGTSIDPSFRYGDYSQMTIDPTDDATFWSIGEVFYGGSRKNRVGVFQFAPPELTADFTGTPRNVCNGGSVTFVDASLGSPTSWEWSFPGGTPSNYAGQNPPPISFNVSGPHDVSLNVSDGNDTDETTKEGYITVENVIADFSGAPQSVVVGNTVTFTDLSDCNPTNWLWNFDGGTPNSFTGQNPPLIMYYNEGSYEVSLTVSNDMGTNTKSIADYISVVPPEFNMQNGSVTTCEGNFYDFGGSSGLYQNNEDFVLTFHSASAGAQLKFNFLLFDVESQTACNYDYLNIYDGENTSAPIIGKYCGTDSPGMVTSSNTAGAITFEWHSDVSVTKPGWNATISCSTSPPVADFSASDTSPAPGADVVFTDLSSNGPNAWAWAITPATFTFVNGTNAESQNPEVQFNDLDAYTVTLDVTNPYGSDTESKINYINVMPCSHCTAGGNDGDEEWISNVTFNTINNSSDVGTGYTDYTSISTDVDPGSIHNLSVSCGSTGEWVENFWVFFDWNQDCDFEDANESFDLGETTGPGSLNTNITVPADAVPGDVRMRVFVKFSSDPLDACDEFSFGEVEDYTVNVVGEYISLDLKAMLEGSFNGSQMTTNLNSMLPMAQPFNVVPWNYYGSESVVDVPNQNVTDWVLIELRDAASAATAYSGTLLSKKAALILNNGDIVGLDGSSKLQFPASINQNLYVVIWHRNHLGIISNYALTLSGDTYVYDFTSGVNQVLGGLSGHKELAPGIWGMFSGDGDRNGAIGTGDKSPTWEAEAGSLGYIFSDYNMDGESNNIDKDEYWVPNIGNSSQVPE